MPSASSNYVTQKRKSKEEGEMTEKPTKVEMPPFADFQLINRICYLCKITNQLRQSGNPVTSEFELALLHFTLSFKNHVLTDSRMIMLGTSIADDG